MQESAGPFAFYDYKIARESLLSIDYDTPFLKLQDHLTCSNLICYYISISFVSVHGDAS